MVSLYVLLKIQNEIEKQENFLTQQQIQTQTQILYTNGNANANTNPATALKNVHLAANNDDDDDIEENVLDSPQDIIAHESGNETESPNIIHAIKCIYSSLILTFFAFLRNGATESAYGQQNIFCRHFLCMKSMVLYPQMYYDLNGVFSYFLKR